MKRPVESAVSTHEIEVAHGGRLHVVEAGHGPVIVLIPGFTMAWTVFERQVPRLMQTHRVITFDPRGQGASTTTFEGNTYRQHASDLVSVLDALAIEWAALVGWSTGALEAYEYLEQRGCDRISHVVIFDQTPRPWPAADDLTSTWGESDWSSFRAGLNSLIEDRATYCDELIDWMTSRPLDPVDRAWLTEMHYATKTTVAATLAMDWMFRDYTATAESVDAARPVLHVVADENREAATPWLAAHTPNTTVETTCSHFGFWEDADAFNDQLLTFVS